MEIAKIRAYRSLINLIQKQYNIQLPIHIHANTSQLNKSNVDAYTNLLRTTTEGMSAIIGGCNSLSVLPYNYGFTDTDSFSNRIARNQQHILKQESYLDKVWDISKGSYYIETITQQIAEKAWEKFSGKNFKSNASDTGSAKPDPNFKAAADEISAGGKSVKNITVNIKTLNEGGINISTTKLPEAQSDIERQFMNWLLRAIQGAELAVANE